VTRIVLDANFLARGHFSVRRLRHLVDSFAGSGVEIVVPEVVVWEWAEHTAATVDALVEQHERFPVDRSLYAPPPLPQAPTRTEFVSIVMGALPKEITLWKPSKDDWRAAVEAQVLQTGTGERKEGVKTGAADHVVMACVRSQMDERLDAEAIVLATGDKNLQRVCKAAFGGNVLYASSDQELLTRLIEFEPAADELAYSVEEELRHRVNSPGSDIGGALEVFSMGFDVVSRREGKRESARELARLGRVDIVELHDLEVGRFQAGARVGHANLRIFADVHMTVLELRREGAETEWVQTYSGLLSGGMIDVPISVTFDRDWNLISVAPAAPAQIDFSLFDDDEDFDEESDA
jgi:rRNA-processing protein FCF1